MCLHTRIDSYIIFAFMIRWLENFLLWQGKLHSTAHVYTTHEREHEKYWIVLFKKSFSFLLLCNSTFQSIEERNEEKRQQNKLNKGN